MEKRVNVRRLVACLLALLLLLSLPACASTEPATEEFWGMGTLITITLYGSNAAIQAGMRTARSLAEELDALWSLNQTESDIARLNRSETGIPDADPRTVALLTQAKALSALTDGCFDITLAGLSALWAQCGAEDRLPTQAELDPLLAAVGTQALTAMEDGTVKKPAGATIDLGAIAKGAAAEAMADALRTIEGLQGGLISLGSCLAAFGEKPNGKPFRIAVRDPQDGSQTAGTLPLQNGQYLSVSGDYERYVTIQGTRYHHILDPQTGYPCVSGLSSVAVLAANGATADTLSTALMVMGEERALALYHAGTVAFEAVLIRADGTVVTTDHIEFQER